MKISYFAWLKDKVGIAEEEIILPTDVTTVNMLIDWLSSRGQNYKDAFEFSEVIKVAINEAYAHGHHPVSDDDEVIFFPPIAGG